MPFHWAQPYLSSLTGLSLILNTPVSKSWGTLSWFGDGSWLGREGWRHFCRWNLMKDRILNEERTQWDISDGNSPCPKGLPSRLKPVGLQASSTQTPHFHSSLQPWRSGFKKINNTSCTVPRGLPSNAYFSPHIKRVPAPETSPHAQQMCKQRLKPMSIWLSSVYSSRLQEISHTQPTILIPIHHAYPWSYLGIWPLTGWAHHEQF